MRVKCVICDKVESIDDELLIAKRLRNRPIHTYMCQACYNRIEEKTNARIATGKFRLYEDKKTDDSWI
ncbi:YlaI family protein [Metabacillus sp. HB246100]|uniref:YlaI family protein n=1 Tax=Bacillus weihaiensis TaxID=1547283 RepID=UPI002355028A|nr:YlaI family protein [Bacillus weihaiensis]